MTGKEEYFDPSADSPSNAHWLPWIQKELLMRDYIAQTPEFLEPYLPQYEKWVQVFEQFELEEDTLLVGHSCGAGFLLRYLSENNIQIGQLVLVAPWIDPTNMLKTDFFDFEINPSILDRAESVTIFSSLDDMDMIIKSVEAIKENLPEVNIIEFEDKGHFCLSDMNTREFPELLDTILKNK